MALKIGKEDSQMRMVVAGASGFLGTYLMDILKDGNEVYGTCLYHRKEHLVPVDLTDEKATHHFLESVSPEIIIQTVALTDVDDCQRDIKKAYELNVRTTKNIISWQSRNQKARLVYISTDHVYNGKKRNREDEINPINIYALTKLFAEDISLTAPNSLVLRVNYFGTFSVKMTYFDWLLHNYRKKENSNVFTDVFFSPLYVKHLCKLIARSIDIRLTGLYNLGACDSLSKKDFAIKVADIFNFDYECLNPVKVDMAGLYAMRPKKMAMDSGRFEKALGIKLPTVEESIMMAFEDITGRKKNAFV